MKKTFAMILVFACVLALMGTLTGCSKGGNDIESVEKTAVCFVIGNHANSQGLNLNSPLVQDTVYTTIRNYGYIAVVNTDGASEIVFASSFDIDEKYKSASSEKLDMDARSKATSLLVGMQSVVADDPECDYMEALRLAVLALQSLEGYDSKSVIVVGTGLNTSGVLNFQNNLLSAEPDVVVELLNEKAEIPDFTDITVYWQELAATTEPQQALSSAQKNKLQQIYSGIVEAGGGTFIFNDYIPNAVDESVDYPSVTPVELPADTPISFDPVDFEELDEDENVFEEPVILTEEQVTFIGDKAEYLHPEEAESVLKPIADYLANNQVTILACGSTAGDTNSDFTMELSQARAEAVKQTLVELGVAPDRIIAVGLGSSDPWHIYGVGYDGAAASSNRKVVLLDAASETAASILEKSNS